MNCYKIDFGEYKLYHSYDQTYFEFFEFDGKKYPIGAHVNLNDNGMLYMYHNGRYDYKKGDFRLIDHWIDQEGKERWEYIIGWKVFKDLNMPIIYRTTKPPAEYIKEVISEPFDEAVYTPGELEVEFQEEKFNYSPKDWEVEGVIGGWVILIIVMLVAFVFKDWWIRLIIQIGAGWYFGSWRDKKMNEAIRNQKFKK